MEGVGEAENSVLSLRGSHLAASMPGCAILLFTITVIIRLDLGGVKGPVELFNHCLAKLLAR